MVRSGKKVTFRVTRSAPSNHRMLDNVSPSVSAPRLGPVAINKIRKMEKKCRNKRIRKADCDVRTLSAQERVTWVSMYHVCKDLVFISLLVSATPIRILIRIPIPAG